MHHPSFATRCLRAVILGLPGVAALPFLLEPPPGAPAAALAIGPAILLVAASLAGAWASVRVGVRSWLVLGDGPTGKDAILGIAAGVVAGLAAATIDQATISLWRGEAIRPQSVIETVSPRMFAIGALYGGLTEEIVFRWGLGAAVAALALTILPRRFAVPLAIVVSATLFALAHLPAAFAGVEIWETRTVVRTLGWNAILGLLFGALLFGRGLEPAILAHVGFHCGAAMTAVFQAG
jgi:membrane protease YdiL (CAAX protease family)